MKTIVAKVDRASSRYSVHVGDNILSLLVKDIAKRHRNRKIAIIIDSAVMQNCRDILKPLFSSLEAFVLPIRSGEQSKTRAMKERIENTLLDNGFGRDTLLIAIGGGVITDLSGYVASTYCRGVPIIHVPTTLLAMADASIGGKTGVNTPHGKNLIGSLWQPDGIFEDMRFLKSLSQEEFLSGLAEIAKIAATCDVSLFRFLEKNHERILARDARALEHIISTAIALKLGIVAKDESEMGLRQTLNFGHTAGHAIEKCTKFSLKHGFCVSIGVAIETRISVLEKVLDKGSEERIRRLLKALKLPVSLKGKFSEKEILDAMKLDKKSRHHQPRIVLLKRIGSILQKKGEYSFQVDPAIIREGLRAGTHD